MATRTSRRDAAKRHMGVLEDSTNMAVEGVNGKMDSTSDDVALLIQGLEKGLARQLEATKADVVTWKEEQLQAYKTGVIRINKNIRNMTVAEFNRSHNCNVLDLLKGVRANSNSKKIPAPMCGKRDRTGMETPAPYRGNRPMRTPATVLRTVRRGEML